jgi:hypothetical protein
VIFGCCATIGACSTSESTAPAPTLSAMVTLAAAPATTPGTTPATSSATDPPSSDGAPATSSDPNAAPASDAPIDPRTTSLACSIVTTADVAAAFGGTVADGVVNGDDGSCNYEITGRTKTGDSGSLATASLSLGADYTSYAEAQAVFADIEQIDGVSQQAWYYPAAHELHVDVGGSELLVAATIPGDEAAIKAEIIAFARAVIGKL